MEWGSWSHSIFCQESERNKQGTQLVFSFLFSLWHQPSDGDTHVQNKTFLLSKLPWKHPPGHPAAQFLGDSKSSPVYSEDWPEQQGPLVHAWWSLTQGRLFWERSFSSSQDHPMNKEDRVLEGLQIPVQAATAGACQSVLIQAVDFLTIFLDRHVLLESSLTPTPYGAAQKQPQV